MSEEETNTDTDIHVFLDKYKPDIDTAWANFLELDAAGDLPGAVMSVGRVGHVWGQYLVEAFETSDKAEMEELDPLSRAFVVLSRGGVFGDIRKWPPVGVFLQAFNTIQYPENFCSGRSIGGYLGQTEEGDLVFQQMIDGVPREAEEGDERESPYMMVEAYEDGFAFNLMPLFVEKAYVIEGFIQENFNGDFEEAIRAYVHDVEIDVDWDVIWTPAGKENEPEIQEDA